MPLQRRVPKWGFTNIFKVQYQIINLNALQRVATEKKLDAGVLNPEKLKMLGLVSSITKPIKILGKGEIKVKLNLEVNACSQSAKEKIEAAGGSIKMI